MQIEMVGGPLDGRTLTVEGEPNAIRVPQAAPQQGAIWVEENEPSPGYIDDFGDWKFGHKPEYIDHRYTRGDDGRYHYQGVA